MTFFYLNTSKPLQVVKLVCLH